jgi:hypothetical protein
VLGKKILLVLPLLVACGAQDFHDEVTERRLVAWIDDRQFQRVLSFIDFEATADEQLKLEPIMAEAHMGLGGFELLGLIENMKAPLVFARPGYEAMSNNCPPGALKAAQLYKLEQRCLMVRLFNSLPDPDDAHLKHARDIWFAHLERVGTLMAPENRLLAITFQSALIISRAGKILADYYERSAQPLQRDDVTGILHDLKIIAVDAKEALDSHLVTARELNRRFLGGDKGAIFEEKLQSRLQFAQNTALPKLIAISDMENQGLEERVLRGEVIKELDGILETYFKVNFSK